ncbi:MAG: hypothetical protein ABR562_02535 [Thermoplasmatota archaeon]
MHWSYAVAIASLVAGCAAPAPSGIQGHVLVGPTCPVQHDPPQPGCDDRPLQTRLVAADAESGKAAAEFSSGADGSYKVTLAPGTYVVRQPDGAATPPTCAPTEPVTVRAGAYATLNVSCDSGIR